MFRQRLPFTQLVLATLLGVAGGLYIYKPYFEPAQKISGQENTDVPQKQNKMD
ncbi:protein PIGBOS1 [Oryzias melastigma]|uniref:protein PIGBOS1 n=1 Tax=Oryzias melastigma TaxID=30732 RepID=UPI000CF81053|nr:protein PIGBOS1 [Oryzias melastigma]XP_024151502.1 protein PIGBOS1 [Oryzias melastigma]XP_024151503.1 protein PIGBOS1 [Oryzias melastigma]